MLPNVASMQTRAPRPDRPGIDLRRLVAGFLRMAPDVAIVGEVRDREALPLLLTLSSGVKGFTTIHAATARAALGRIRFLAELSESTRSLPHSALTTLVADAVDLVVFSQRGDDGPQVTEIVAVEDLAGSPEAGAFTVTEVFTRTGPGRDLQWTGDVPHRLAGAFASAGRDVLAVLDDRTAPRSTRPGVRP